MMVPQGEKNNKKKDVMTYNAIDFVKRYTHYRDDINQYAKLSWQVIRLRNRSINRMKMAVL
jgi:hypothetical protein